MSEVQKYLGSGGGGVAGGRGAVAGAHCLWRPRPCQEFGLGPKAGRKWCSPGQGLWVLQASWGGAEGGIAEAQQERTHGQASLHWRPRQGCLPHSVCSVFRPISVVNSYLRLEYSISLAVMRTQPHEPQGKQPQAAPES